ncbi:hypothetical protein [Chryseobacterium sp.]|uniref:hypothetical protein n=1 Tax=Chryseobacterium sp. TaxID=1871047 RepID=UPI0025C02CEB|nr:hypothetical protein [Chryseobacterium sp.]MBV8328598.1 hypothetical protein [Chryseobacterium sp.]
MKNIYRNYNEEDLLTAYLDVIDHTGKMNDEMEEMIRKKFYYNEFVKKAEYKRILIKEKARISFEVYNKVEKGECLDAVLKDTFSEIIESKELVFLISEKFYQFSVYKKNNTIDIKTLYSCLLGTLVSSGIGVLFFVMLISILNEFSFLLLIPLYIINYFIIKLITGKTRDNLIVFLAVFISVIISTILFFVLKK